MISDGPDRPWVPAARGGVDVTAFAVAMAALAFIACGYAAATVNPFLEYRRLALADFEAWRLVTAHVAHLDLRHGLLNAAGLGLVWWLGRGTLRPVEWLVLAGTALIAVDAGLYWLSPQVDWYVGASGVLHGLIAGIAVLAYGRGERLFGAALGLALAAKLAWEATGGAFSSALLPVVTDAHLYGAIGGALAGLVMQARGRRL